MGEAGIALENASVDRPVDEFHFECPKCLRQSRLNCLGRHFSLSYLIEIIQWASPALKGKSTEGAVRASDKRAIFVGIEAYEAAGGVVLRDLFAADQGGWLQDVALLDRLAREKLGAAADAIRAEGWKWTEVSIDFPYGHTQWPAAVAGELRAALRRGAGTLRSRARGV